MTVPTENRERGDCEIARWQIADCMQCCGQRANARELLGERQAVPLSREGDDRQLDCLLRLNLARYNQFGMMYTQGVSGVRVRVRVCALCACSATDDGTRYRVQRLGDWRLELPSPLSLTLRLHHFLSPYTAVLHINWRMRRNVSNQLPHGGRVEAAAAQI